MKKRPQRTLSASAVIGAGFGAGIWWRAAAFIWLVPALAVNLNWSSSGSIPWNLSAAFSIAASAVIFEAARHLKSRSLLILLVLFGTLFFCFNIANGFRNAVTRSGDLSDVRRGDIAAAERVSETRSRLITSREAATAIAGETPAARFRADIEQRKAADARRWQATRGCDAAGGITLPESQTFCAGIATLRGQLEAAEQRDRIDQQLAVIDLRREQTAPPASADPFADSAAAVLNAAGFAFAPASVRIFFDALSAIIPELMAAGLPALTLFLIERRQEAPRVPASQPPRAAAKRDEQANAAAPAAPVEPVEADLFSRFIADMIETAPGERIKAGDAYAAYEKFCATQDGQPKPETIQKFGRRMGEAFASDDRHKRKHYLNIRLKRHPHLRLISAA